MDRKADRLGLQRWTGVYVAAPPGIKDLKSMLRRRKASGLSRRTAIKSFEKCEGQPVFTGVSRSVADVVRTLTVTVDDVIVA